MKKTRLSKVKSILCNKLLIDAGRSEGRKVAIARLPAT